MMFFVIVGLFCHGGINSNGFDVGFGDILIDSLFCVGFMCEEVVCHWLGTFPVGCWLWFCVRDLSG